MTKVLKATISGSFKASDGEIESFDRVVGYLPALDDAKAQQMIIKRYAMIWVSQTMKKDARGNDIEEPKYKRVDRIRQVFVDEVIDEEGKQLSYVGKAIMDMNFEELQDLASAKDLAAIPLYKKTSLQQARRIAFAEYASKVLDWKDTVQEGKKIKEVPVDWRSSGFNPSKYPVIIADAEIRRSGEHIADIEESIDRENLVMQGKAVNTPAAPSRLTIDHLKAIAKDKGIEFSANIGYDTLYKRIYGKESSAA